MRKRGWRLLEEGTGERVEKKRLCLGMRTYVLHAHGVRMGGKENRPAGLRAGGLCAREGPTGPGLLDASLLGLVCNYWALN